jgi:hypothetical protein
VGVNDLLRDSQARATGDLVAINLNELVEDLRLVPVEDSYVSVFYRDVYRFVNRIGVDLDVIPRLRVPEGV